MHPPAFSVARFVRDVVFGNFAHFRPIFEKNGDLITGCFGRTCGPLQFIKNTEHNAGRFLKQKGYMARLRDKKPQTLDENGPKDSMNIWFHNPRPKPLDKINWANSESMTPTDPDETLGTAGDGYQLQSFPGMVHHGDVIHRNYGGIGFITWFRGNLTCIRGQFQVMAFHKPFHPQHIDKRVKREKFSHFYHGKGFKHDAVTYGYILPGFIPLQYRGMCVNSQDLEFGANEWKTFNRYQCMDRRCKCKKKNHCYYDELCPNNEPWHGLGCFVDSNKFNCRECGYSEFAKIPCSLNPLDNE